MKNGSFRLEPLLNYKRLIEEKLQQELAMIKECLLKEEERLDALIARKERSVRQFTEHPRSEILLQEVLLYHHFLNQITLEVDRQKGVLDEIKKRLEEKRDELVRASHEKKVVERLKQKRDRIDRKERAKAERRILEEVALHRYRRGGEEDSVEK